MNWKFWKKMSTELEDEVLDDESNVENSDDGHEDKIASSEIYSQSDPKESTRSRIAQIYVIAFFCVIGVVFYIGYNVPFSVDEYKDMLVTVSGILSGPLGFIVGYYFKASSK